MEKFKIVLVNPMIPPNTGNIARTCAATNTELHLVGDLGFLLGEKQIRRAGLDYWKNVNLNVYPDAERYLTELGNKSFHLFTTKTDRLYTEAEYNEGDYLVFGSETKGLSEEILNKYPDRLRNIPMNRSNVRSLNLSNCAGIVLYEALRQTNFQQVNHS